MVSDDSFNQWAVVWEPQGVSNGLVRHVLQVQVVVLPGPARRALPNLASRSSSAGLCDPPNLVLLLGHHSSHFKLQTQPLATMFVQ